MSLAGGASNRQVVIALSDTDLRLVSVAPNRRSLRGAYSLSDQHLRQGGSQFVVTLNAVQSIPRGSFLVFTFRARGARAQVVRCRGGSSSCTARVSLAGGASNRRVVIQLTDTDLRLVSVAPNRRSLRGSYSLTDQRLREGGSEFVVTLNAVQSIPRGSFLVFKFRAGAPEAQVVRCRGGSSSCTARVSLAGGASNRRVVIQLTDSDLRLVSVAPNRRSLRGSYSLTDQRLREGGSEFVVTLNAVQSIPRGSLLIFSFAAVGGG